MAEMSKQKMRKGILPLLLCVVLVFTAFAILPGGFGNPDSAYAEKIEGIPVVPYTVGDTAVYELDDLRDNPADAAIYYELTVDKAATIDFYMMTEWDDTVVFLFDSAFEPLWAVSDPDANGYDVHAWTFISGYDPLSYYCEITTALEQGTYYVLFANMDQIYYTNAWIGFMAELSEGWRSADGKWYYYTDGSAKTGWQKISSKYYYFDAKNGDMKTGWQNISGTWYYFGSASDGKMTTGWKAIGGKWYYFGSASDGKMTTGWKKLSGKYYYFDAKNGDMKTGWQKIGGKYYYLGSASDGKMVTGKQKIGGKTYTFTSNGVWIK